MINRVILFAALEGHEQGLARMRKQFAPIFERLMEYVARRQREGAFVGCDPNAIMIALGGIAHQYGLITQIFRAPTPETSDDDIANLFTRIVLNGVRETSSTKSKSSKTQPAKESMRKAKK
jgi:hypothetical protein